MKNLLVGQSGGPTAVINGSLYGVITEAFRHPEEIEHVYGMRNGIDGFLKDHYIDLAEEMNDEKLHALQFTPGAFLGSCRYKLPEDLNHPVYPQLFEKFNAMNIGYFLYIGGNDSMDTVSKLSRYAQMIDSDILFIGVPKTIDNDLVLTDHTPGFGSASKYVATTVREICIDSSIYDINSVTIIEIMGRHAGWLTAASALARKFPGDNPAMIYLPEVAFDQDAFIERLAEEIKKRHNVFVCVSEGIRDAEGKFICEYASEAGTDNFGHKMLAGSGKYLENLVRARLGVKVRSVELNVSQRCSAGYQSQTDLSEAIMAGTKGVEAALEGQTGIMITFHRTCDQPYILTCKTADVNLICNQEKTVPLEWIFADGTDVSEELVNYILPLIQGKVTVPSKNGLPAFAYLED